MLIGGDDISNDVITLGTCFAIEGLRFTFTPNGEREFVPRDQVFSLFCVYCLLLLHKNHKNK